MTDNKRDAGWGPGVGGVRSEQNKSKTDSPPIVRMTGRQIRPSWQFLSRVPPPKISEKTGENGFPEFLERGWELWRQSGALLQGAEHALISQADTNESLIEMLGCLRHGHFPTDCPEASVSHFGGEDG